MGGMEMSNPAEEGGGSKRPTPQSREVERGEEKF